MTNEEAHGILVKGLRQLPAEGIERVRKASLKYLLTDGGVLKSDPLGRRIYSPLAAGLPAQSKRRLDPEREDLSLGAQLAREWSNYTEDGLPIDPYPAGYVEALQSLGIKGVRRAIKEILEQ